MNKAQTICTHEGAAAKQISAEQQLRRSVMSCLLWEKEFYEDGKDIAARIAALVPRVKPPVVDHDYERPESCRDKIIEQAKKEKEES